MIVEMIVGPRKGAVKAAAAVVRVVDAVGFFFVGNVIRIVRGNIRKLVNVIYEVSNATSCWFLDTDIASRC